MPDGIAEFGVELFHLVVYGTDVRPMSFMVIRTKFLLGLILMGICEGSDVIFVAEA